MLAIGLLILGILSRVIIHIPNFTPIIALSLFSGAYFPRKYAVVLPLALMILSDSIVGFHSTIGYTWGSVVLITLLGLWLKSRKTPSVVLGTSFVSALLFFFITNFGTWLTGELYPMTMDGLKECFILAIPFFRATFLSTLIYVGVFFGVYEFFANRLKESKLARVLLLK